MTHVPRSDRCRTLALLALAAAVLAPATLAHFGGQQRLAAISTDARGVFAEDLDGDGDLDVLTATRVDGRISWYENLGGEFGLPRVITSAASGARAVFAADLDGDGDRDVLSASALDDEIAWYENLGGGAFGPQQVISTSADGAESVHAVDLDGDGDRDVLSASALDGKVAWYENLGGGAFGAEQVLTNTLPAAFRVTAADLDGDLDADVLAIGYDALVWFENLGGAFGSSQVISTEIVEGNDVEAADLDGDGDLDVLSAGDEDEALAWYENLGGGSFGLQQVITTVGADKHDLSVGDFDGDGDLDLVAASSTTSTQGEIAWYENDAGTFAVHRTISTLVGGARAVFVGDLDADGDLDVVSGSNTLVAWYENTGAGIFGRPSGVSDSTAEQLLLVDLDGDGDEDALRSRGVYGGLLWSENLGGGVFGPDRIPGSVDLGYTAGVTAGDLDGDGDLDLAAVDGFSGLVISENLGSGVFADFVVLHEEVVMSGGLDVADVDGDGDTDLLAVPNDQVVWYENVGSFPLQGGHLIGAGTWTVHGADLDGDGDVDVLKRSPAHATWHENLGGGVFAPQQQFAGSTGNPSTGDLAGDGLLDVLVAGDNKLAWFENLGGGTFGPRVTIPTTVDGLWHAHAADLDADGDADIIATGNIDGRVVWFENLGAGAFTLERVAYAAFGRAASAVVVDLDQDGRVEIVAAGIGYPGSESGLVILHPGPAFTRYCAPAVPNSSGRAGFMLAYGSEVVSDDQLRLVARDLPLEPNTGYFLMGQGMNVVTPPGSAGPVCVGPGIMRLLPSPSSTTELEGGFAREIGTDGPVSGSITPGSTWNFQAWFRDQAAGTSNLTDAVSVGFR